MRWWYKIWYGGSKTVTSSCIKIYTLSISCIKKAAAGSRSFAHCHISSSLFDPMMLLKSSLLVILAAWSLMVLADNAQLRERGEPQQHVASDPCIDACDSKGMASLKACLKNKCNSDLDPSGPPLPTDKPLTAGNGEDTMTLCESNCYGSNNPMMYSCYDSCMKKTSQPKTQNPTTNL